MRADRQWSQADLAERLGVSRQTVNAIESGRTEPSLPLALRIAWVFGRPVEQIFIVELEEKMNALEATWAYKNCRATAFDELGVLDRMGREGWELMSFGALTLRFRRPEDEALRVSWQYYRVEGLMSSANRTANEMDGWIFCGSWLSVFHYFKRQVAAAQRG